MYFKWLLHAWFPGSHWRITKSSVGIAAVWNKNDPHKNILGHIYPSQWQKHLEDWSLLMYFHWLTFVSCVPGYFWTVFMVFMGISAILRRNASKTHIRLYLPPLANIWEMNDFDVLPMDDQFLKNFPFWIRITILWIFLPLAVKNDPPKHIWLYLPIPMRWIIFIYFQLFNFVLNFPAVLYVTIKTDKIYHRTHISPSLWTCKILCCKQKNLLEHLSDPPLCLFTKQTSYWHVLFVLLFVWGASAV